MIARLIISVLLLGLESAAQTKITQPTADNARIAIVGLRDDAAWQRHAARLVELRGGVGKMLGKALQRATNDADDEMARRILMVLDRMGMDAQDATESIWDSLEDQSSINAEPAVDALVQITPVGGPDPMHRVERMMVRMFLGREGGLRGMDFILKLNAVLLPLASKAEMKPDMGLDALLSGLGKNVPETREVYCQLIAAKGKQARAAIPTLIRLLRAELSRDRSRHKKKAFGRNLFSMRLADAIVRVHPLAKAAATAHAYRIANDPFRELRMTSARELMMLGPHVQEVVPQLVAFLRKGSADGELLRAVIHCLAMTGAKANKAVPYLERLAESADEKTAARAAAALLRIRQRRAT